MIGTSQLAILVGAIALVCVISMMLHVRAEKTRRRIDDLEQRIARMDSGARRAANGTATNAELAPNEAAACASPATSPATKRFATR